MTSHIVTAMFASRTEAERVARILVSELSIAHSAVDVRAQGVEPSMGYDSSNLWDAAGLEPQNALFMSDSDRRTYFEGLRRGHVLLSASVQEGQIGQASDLLEHSGALDLREDDQGSREAGWTGASQVEPYRGAVTPVIEEHPVVGTLGTKTGRTRVRTYAVEPGRQI